VLLRLAQRADSTPERSRHSPSAPPTASSRNGWRRHARVGCLLDVLVGLLIQLLVFARELLPRRRPSTRGACVGLPDVTCGPHLMTTRVRPVANRIAGKTVDSAIAHVGRAAAGLPAGLATRRQLSMIGMCTLPRREARTNIPIRQVSWLGDRLGAAPSHPPALGKDSRALEQWHRAAPILPYSCGAAGDFHPFPS
jgi:hypothetical protein